MAQPVVAEGKRWYRSETASWYGTDLFIAKHPDQSDISGYLSYTENTVSKCIFFFSAMAPDVIGTISFNSTYNTATADTDFTLSAFTPVEKELYTLWKAADALITADTFFKSYQHTHFKLIPLITNNKKSRCAYRNRSAGSSYFW